MEITLRDDGDIVEYDFIVTLGQFKQLPYWLIQAAYIDGWRIEIQATDPDNIDRRWFSIRYADTDGKMYTVYADGWREYSGEELVYVELFGVQVWQRYIDDTNGLLIKYGNKEQTHGR